IASDLYKKYEVKRGLRDEQGKGVVAGLTTISTVYPEKVVNGQVVPGAGELRYRGIAIDELVDGFVLEERFGFEETAYLLLFGELPTEEELAEFQQLISSHRTL